MMAVALGVVLLLGIASVSLAAVEAAFYLCKRRRIAHLGATTQRVEMVNHYLEDPPSLLVPVHVGTYTAHLGMALVLAWIFAGHVQHWGLVAAFLSMIVYLLAFRLSLPYALVRRAPEKALVLLLPYFHAYAGAMGPLVRAMRRSPVTSRVFGEPEPETRPPAELPPAPVHEADEMRLLDAVGRFAVTQVKDVMTPRPDMAVVAGDAPVRDVQHQMRDTKYSRLPVYGDDLDDIVGVIAVRDLVAFEGDLAAPVRSLVREVYLVPETKKIAELLKEFQASRTTFAVVINEYGGSAGVVTMEDIVEELVGEIEDEYDLEAEPLLVEPDGAVVAAGKLNVDRLALALDTSLSDEGIDTVTVGGLVTSVFGHIPQAGERREWRGFRVEVLDAGRRRVNRVRFRRLPPPETSA